MARIRHLAIATDTPDESAQFYVDAFGLRRVREFHASWGHGHVLTDGELSVSVIRYTVARAAGSSGAPVAPGLHHLGVEVDDVLAARRQLEALGVRRRADIGDALGIAPGGAIDVFETADGVVFDLGGAAVWGPDVRGTATKTGA